MSEFQHLRSFAVMSVWDLTENDPSAGTLGLQRTKPG